MPKDKCVLPPIVKDLPKEVEKVVPLVVTTAQQAVRDIGTTIDKAFKDGIVELSRVPENIKTNADKAVKDSNAEAQRFGREVDAAGRALAKYAQSSVSGHIQSLRQAEERVRAGKAIDAIWHAALSPVQVAEKSASDAVLESSYLRAVGQVAASSYGGPAGAAAYAAWLTYRETGNASLALRVGILTGASASAFGAAGKIDDTVKRTIVTAAVGGAAVAAAGGSEEAVKQAFLQAGAMVVVQDGFRSFSGHDLDGKAAKGEPYCLTATQNECTPVPTGAITGVDKDGNFIVDVKKLDPTVPQVGLKNHSALFSEQNVLMKSASRIPGIQGMAVFHDAWAITWDMGTLMTPATILPAIVLTYTGLGAPYYEQLRVTAAQQALDAGKPGPPPDLRTYGEALAPHLVVDSYLKVRETGDFEMVAHEVNIKRTIYCYDGTLVKMKLKVSPLSRLALGVTEGSTPGQKASKARTSVEVDQCIREIDVKAPWKAKPPNYYPACRVLKLEAGVWRVIATSKFDYGYCNPTVQAVTSPIKTEKAVWMRGDARRRENAFKNL
jgi:hypothetical protein